MPWWLWLAWSVPLGAWFWRVTFRAMVDRDRGRDWDSEIREIVDRPLDAETVVMNAFTATLLFLVLGPGLLIHSAFIAATRTTDWDRTAALLGGESRAQKRRRREREMAAREARVREAERDLGIGP